MNNKSIKKNYIYNLLYQIILVLTPLVTTPYLSRVLGVSGIGRVSYVESVVSYFMLFANLGIATFGQREISYNQNDISKRSIVFYNVLIFKTIISSIVLLFYLLLCIFVFKSNLYIVFVFSILSVVCDVTWFFQGLEDFKTITIRNCIFRFLNIIFIVVCVKNKNDILIYCFIVAFFTFLSNLSLVPYLKNKILPIDKSYINPFKDFNTIISLFLPTIAIQIYTVLDKTMIGIITKDTIENGYYEQSSKISKFLLFIVTALGTVVIPRIGYYYNQNDKKSLKELIYKSYRWTLLIAIPMCFLLIALSENIVPWFLGDEFSKSIILIRILSMLLVFIGLSNVTGLQYMIPTNKQKLLTISLCSGAIINFMLNIIFIRYYKSIGAAFASVVAEFSITFIQLYLVRDEINFIKILNDSYKYIVSGAIMYLLVELMSHRYNPSIFNSTFLMTIGIVVYMLLIIILKDEFIIDIIRSLKMKIFYKK